jgi:hypothetical protein
MYRYLLVTVLITVLYNNSKNVGLKDNAMTELPKPNNYLDWLNSKTAKENVIKNLKKSGFPLELKVRKILRDNNFFASNDRYLDTSDGNNDEVQMMLEKGTWREIDILALNRTIYKQKKDSSVEILQCIVCECKYSSEKDIIVFKHINKDDVDTTNFPVMANGHELLPEKVWDTPLLRSVEKITQIIASKDTKENHNYDDYEIHNAAEQIIAALKYFVCFQRKNMRSIYQNDEKKTQIWEKWQKLIKENKLVYEEKGSSSIVPNSFINDFLKINYNSQTMSKDYPLTTIFLYFPLIVIDENRGIISARLNNSYDVTDLEDMGFCLYSYVPQNTQKYSQILEEGYTVPILLCNCSCLSQVISFINDCTKTILNTIMTNLDNKPELIVKERMFNKRVVGL